MKRIPPASPVMEADDYLLARLIDDEATGAASAMLDVSHFTVDGRWLASVDQVLHFGEEDAVLKELEYVRIEPWGRRSGIRSARVERKSHE
jgi:hypothetical protein